MVRGRDVCWEHCSVVDATRQKVRCNYCRREFSGGVYRMKFHLAQIKNRDVVPCTDVPAQVRDHIQSFISTPKKEPKTSKKVKMDRAAIANGQQNSSSASAEIHQNNDSAEQNCSASPSLFLQRVPPEVQPAVGDAQKQKQDYADKKIATFFFHNSIPFIAAKSIYYQEMVDAVAQCEVGYQAPSDEKLRSTLLERVKGDIEDRYRKYREQWKETGCTILCDSWSDGKTKSLVIFSVTCLKGTLFLKSVDVSNHEDDVNYLFELIESIVLEVGVENVVQVITDTTTTYTYAGRLLMAKYNSLFWSPCASYCVNKMLEDIARLNWVSTVLEEAKSIVSCIYGHAWLLSMMRKFTDGAELIRPRMTRFVTNFLSLRSLVIQEENLKNMVLHTEWSSSLHNRSPDVLVVKALLSSERFWKYAQEAVSISEPLIKILRIVDGDMPAIGYIYEGMDRAKAIIKAFYTDINEKYMPIWDIIDKRWNKQLHPSLHAAAAFLNPSIFYNPVFKVDLGMRNGFQEAMLKMATSEKDKKEIAKETPMYINAHGALGTAFAVLGRTLNAPGDWWGGYGYEVLTLQKYAIRILSQPCSSFWHRWNWRTFENMYNKKLNVAEMETFRDFVFVHSNLQFYAISKSSNMETKPIIFEEIDVNSQWPSEIECVAPVLDGSWLENFPIEGKCIH